MTAWDEMVDGLGRVRPHWRTVLGTISGLERATLVERTARLERAAEDGGAPASWRCDPVPLPLTGAEFDTLQAGLCQRARLLEALLADLYGRQRTVAEGVLPPALVYANPYFLRACRDGEAPRPPLLHAYAADLVRGPDGQWRVLADRTRGAFGAGYARATRRLLARVLPELFRSTAVRPLRPFFEAWQEALIGLAGPGGVVAMLTQGVDDAHWPEHAALSRDLGCALVEARDLTVRDGTLFLKTLAGLQPVDVLLRRVAGEQLDPLETFGTTPGGTIGLLDAARHGATRVLNHPGAAVVEAPAFAAFMPSLCRFLLGEPLLLATLPSLWLADDGAVRKVASGFRRWALRPAFDVATAPAPLAELDREQRTALEASLAATPWNWVGCNVVPPSVAPCHGKDGLEPLPVVLRLFLMHDGTGWRMMPGGVARVLPPGAHAGESLPADGLFKDVWVLADEAVDIAGLPPAPAAAVTVRRGSGDVPSRVVEDFFRLGRTVERVDAQARLGRAGLIRQARGAPLPRELAELDVLRACLLQAGMADDRLPLDAMVSRALRPNGSIAADLADVARLTASLRDRLTVDAHGAFVHATRAVQAADDMDGLVHTMNSVQRLGTTVAGIAADGMVDSAGRLFLDLGRRLERAIGTARCLAVVLDALPDRLEPALRLALELCDSALAYQNRYFARLQRLPALDLLLADPGNPRALAFQLAQISILLDAAGDLELAGEADCLRLRAACIAADGASELAPELLDLAGAASILAERVTRRFFAARPALQHVGLVVA